MRFLYSLTVFLFTFSNVFAQIEIAPQNRVENFGHGYCAWCCIETLGRHHGVKKLYNLAKKRSQESDFKHFDPQTNTVIGEPYVWVSHGPNKQGPWVKERHNHGSDWGIYYKMEDLKVKYQMQWSGKTDRDLIKYSMKNKLGICFAVKEGCLSHTQTSEHALILLDYNDKEVEYFDPNKPTETYVATKEWFDYWWTGWLLVVEKE